jgi:YHS domain-containing protein
MKRNLTLLTAIFLAACTQEPPQQPEIVTIEKAPAKMAVVEVPPHVDEEVAPVIPKNIVNLTSAERERIQEAAVAERVVLPFAPAIAMDPVDGQKVSIRKHTPTFEHKGKIYYFTSEGNRKLFMSTPDTYTKGSLAKYQ